MTLIRRLEPSDRHEWLRMRRALYGDDPSIEIEVDRHLQSSDHMTVFVVEQPEGGLCGFMELDTRSFAEGCVSSPVAYIEGLYVESSHRRQNIGRQLIELAENWAREHGLSEIASDALVTNDNSIAFHRAVGFAEVERQVCFRKSVTAPDGVPKRSPPRRKQDW